MATQADLILLADALVTAINGEDWSPHSFQAKRGYTPRPKLTQIGDLTVTVCPAGFELARETRSQLQLGNALEIGVHKKLKLSEDAETDIKRDPDIDELICLVQRLAVFIGAEVLTAGTQESRPLVLATDPLWDPETLDEKGVFLSVLRATYRTWQ